MTSRRSCSPTKRYSGELGENLIKASSASEALQCLLDNEIAVVLVDVCMPDLDGYELAAMIRQHPRFQKTSIIFVSAILMTDLDRLRGYECGAVDYVPVPVVPAILRAKVSVFAELFRKTRALERLNAELEERVTERTSALEATTQALQEANHRKDEFLAMLAHELRNPLAPIRTAVQLLRLKELTEPHRMRARDVIERQVEHLVNLIDDLLDVSRITRGMITLQLEPVLLGAIVARAVETARPAIDAHRHALEIDLPDELISVEGDKTRLVQVIANILHNAAKFMDPGGRIRLSARREGQHAVITIADTGIGIAPELMPKNLRVVHAGPLEVGARAGRAGHRARARPPADRDARRNGHRAQRRRRPWRRVHRAATGHVARRWRACSESAKRESGDDSRESSRSGFSSPTTITTRRRRCRCSSSSRATTSVPPTMAWRRLRWRRHSSQTSCCSISACRRWTATKSRGSFACDQEAGA